MNCPYIKRCFPISHDEDPPRGLRATCINTTNESLERCGGYQDYLKRDGKLDD